MTELPKLSTSNIHVFTLEIVGDARREKAKTDSNAETTQTLVGFKRDKGKYKGSEKSGASAYYANCTSVEDYDYDDDAHNDPVDPGSDNGDEGG